MLGGGSAGRLIYVNPRRSESSEILSMSRAPSFSLVYARQMPPCGKTTESREHLVLSNESERLQSVAVPAGHLGAGALGVARDPDVRPGQKARTGRSPPHVFQRSRRAAPLQPVEPSDSLKMCPWGLVEEADALQLCRGLLSWAVGTTSRRPRCSPSSPSLEQCRTYLQAAWRTWRSKSRRFRMRGYLLNGFLPSSA